MSGSPASSELGSSFWQAGRVWELGFRRGLARTDGTIAVAQFPESSLAGRDSPARPGLSGFVGHTIAEGPNRFPRSAALSKPLEMLLPMRISPPLK